MTNHLDIFLVQDLIKISTFFQIGVKSFLYLIHLSEILEYLTFIYLNKMNKEDRILILKVLSITLKGVEIIFLLIEYASIYYLIIY